MLIVFLLALFKMKCWSLVLFFLVVTLLSWDEIQLIKFCISNKVLVYNELNHVFFNKKKKNQWDAESYFQAKEDGGGDHQKVFGMRLLPASSMAGLTSYRIMASDRPCLCNKRLVLLYPWSTKLYIRKSENHKLNQLLQLDFSRAHFLVKIYIIWEIEGGLLCIK